MAVTEAGGPPTHRRRANAPSQVHHLWESVVGRLQSCLELGRCCTARAAPFVGPRRLDDTGPMVCVKGSPP